MFESAETALTLKMPETKIADLQIDFDEMAHNELPHPDLHCLGSSV